MSDNFSSDLAKKNFRVFISGMNIYFSPINFTSGNNISGQKSNVSSKTRVSKKNTLSNIDNIYKALKADGYSKEAFVEADKKFCSLSQSSADTILKKMNNIVSRFEKEGLTRRQLVGAALKHPSIFVHSPYRLEYNIREAAKYFQKYGMDTKQYLNCALNQPTLFSLAPEKVKGNFEGILKYMQNSGTKTDNFVRIICQNPVVLMLKPENFEEKIKKIVKELGIKGVTEKDILDFMTKQPTTIVYSTGTLLDKFKQLKYIEEVKWHDSKKNTPSEEELAKTVLKKSFTNSMEHNYLILLRNLLAAQRKTYIDVHGLKPRLEKFVQDNVKQTFSFVIPDGEYAKTFRKVVKEFSEKLISKNIFHIKIIK